jgi:hypothetical protein
MSGFLIGIESVADVGGIESDRDLDAREERINGRELMVLPVVERPLLGAPARAYFRL